MIIKDLIDKLKMFDPNQIIWIEVKFDSGCRKIKTTIDDIEWKNGECVIVAEDY